MSVQNFHLIQIIVTENSLKVKVKLVVTKEKWNANKKLRLAQHDTTAQRRTLYIGGPMWIENCHCLKNMVDWLNIFLSHALHGGLTKQLYETTHFNTIEKYLVVCLSLYLKCDHQIK